MKPRIEVVEFDKPRTKFPHKKIKDIVEKIAKAKILSRNYYLSVIIANDDRTKKLNSKYRKKNKPASILSFPINPKKDSFPTTDILVLGDIILNVDRINEEPGELEEKISFSLIHSFLHLLGFNHDTERNAIGMEREEKKLEGVINEKNV